MRPPLFLVALTLSACDNALPKDPTLDQNVDPGGEPQPDTGEEPAVDLDGDGYTADEDCNDDNDAIFPAAEEVCDGVDNDCDDRIDDNDDDVVGETITLYEDRDGDGFGDPDRVMAACVAPDGYVEDATDCDDDRADVGGPTEWYEDHDLDGYAGPDFEVACIQPADTYATTEDCDDEDPEVNPSADDFCGDDIDSDCGGDGDWESCIDIEPADLVGTLDCTADTGTFTVSGDHIQVNYGSHGMWWDEDSALAGLEIDPGGTGSWVDVTYPGTHLDQLFVKRGTSSYTIGSPSGSTVDNLNLLCSTPVAVGDVVGAIHRYNIDGDPVFVLTKTELWNRTDKSMLVHFELAHSVLSSDASFTIQRITDPDQDYDARTNNVFFENRLGDPLLTAEGPETGLTIGIGRCSYQSRNGAYDGSFLSWSTLTEPVDSCDPDGLTADLPYTFQTSATIVPSGGSLERGFVLTVGTDRWESVDEWDDHKFDLCADLYDLSASPITDPACSPRAPPDLIDPAAK